MKMIGNEVPTATAAEHRMRIFDATRRPKAVSRNKISITNQDGSLVYEIFKTGKIGQAHADLLDAICFCAEKKKEEDGRIKLLVDPAKVRKYSGIKSGEQMRVLIDELTSAVIEVKHPVDLACIGHLVDHIDTARKSNGDPVTRHNPLGGERVMWRVELGKAFCKLIEKDVWRGYDPLPVSKIETGVGQAVARHILTHAHGKDPVGGWKVDTLITAVCGSLGGEAMRNQRRYLKEAAPQLLEAGILIDGDRVCRAKQ